jgi:hypothetical protein
VCFIEDVMTRNNNVDGHEIKALATFVVRYPRKTHKVEQGPSLCNIMMKRLDSKRTKRYTSASSLVGCHKGHGGVC